MKRLSSLRDNIAIVVILILALFLRVINIDQNPPALYGDELTLVYDAYSILKTGHDQTGAFLPLTFSMSEGRPPAYVYLSIPFVAIFGPSALSVRALSVFSGVGIALLMFILLQKLITKRIALTAALFIAISPWDLSLSRGGFETHFALFLSLLGITVFVFAKQKPWLMLIGALVFGLSLHTYHSYKVVIPLFLPFLLWFVDLRVLLKIKSAVGYLLSSIVIFSIFLGILFYQLSRGGEIRFQNTSIFNQPDLAASITQKVNEERSLDNTSFASLIHNKIVEYSTLIGDNYFSHFSFNFLFLHGDGNPRHNQGLMGEMYIIDSLLILFGFIWLFDKHRRLFLLLSAWLAVAPLATILVSPAHALRSTFMLPALIILAASGFNYFWELSKKGLLPRLLFIFMLFGLIVQFAFLIDRVYLLYPKQFGRFWSVSAKTASLEALKSRQNYDFIIVSDRIDSINLAFPAYGVIDPKYVIDQTGNNLFGLYGYSFKKFNNIYIGNVPDTEVNNFVNRLPGKVLYLGAAEEVKALKNYATIYGTDGLPLLLKVNKSD